jgi:hypothetical protein
MPSWGDCCCCGGLRRRRVVDRQGQVDLAARLVARHLTLGHSVQVLIVTLARALLREDAGSMPTKRWTRACGSSASGAIPTRAGISSSLSPAISLPIRLRNAPNSKRPKSPGGSCAAVSFIAKPQRDMDNAGVDGEIFYTLREAQIVIESWRRHFNTIRPHASFGKPPAPEVFVPAFAAWPAALRQPASPAMLAPRLVLN